MWQYLRYGLRVSLLIVLIAGPCKPLSASGDVVGEEKSNCTSFLVISGESNVNGFELIWTSGGERNQDDKGFSVIDSSDYIYSIPVRDFKASNFLMYDDFIKLMKAEEYPRIVLKISQDQLKVLRSGGFYKDPEISITIAGVTRLFNIPCSVLYCQDNTLVINGTQQINLRDFQMTPPVKLQGLVKVKEEINVSFGIIINFTDPNQKIASS